MTNTLKNEIVAATKEYMAAMEMTAADMNILSGVSQSYLSALLNGKTSVPGQGGGKDTEIADKYFFLLADAIGFNTEKQYWKTIITKQVRQIITKMTTSKAKCEMATIICETGMGKTVCKDLFQREHPKHTYVVTINSLMKIHDVINTIMFEMRLPQESSKAMRLIRIVQRLRELKREGRNPCIIFDEAENMEHGLMKMMKGLYDGIAGYASIIKIGTPKLLEKMEMWKSRDMDGGPQYYRRFKASIVRISSVPDFEPFYDAFGIEDKKVRKLLEKHCYNYGELNSYLEPALREADERGLTLTEDFFRVKYDLAA
jgi:DNA transposition AAA+ family ATPase